MKKNLLLLFLTLSVTFNCFSQFSKTHYIPPLSYPSDSGSTIGKQIMYISTPSTSPVNFIIKQLGGTNVSGTVSRDAPFIFDVNSSDNPNQLFNVQSEISTIQSNKGYIIEAGDLVYVSVRITSGDQNQNQAGQIVSKGLAGLGTEFRIGAFINTGAPSFSQIHSTFVSILATENNTTIQFDDIKPGVILINNAGAGNTPSSITLNAGQSFVMAVQGPNDANRDGLIGSLVTSDKPIVVNCGSIAGTNGTLSNIDYGFDQIVSAERTGKDYIFTKSTGFDAVERALLVANEDDTEIFVNGNTTTIPDYTIDAGEYVALDGATYNASGNLFVHSSKNIFVYQSVGDDALGNEANQQLFFVPPLSCQTPKSINNIPFIELIDDRVYTGRVTIITKVASDLSFIINSVPYTLASLPAGISVVGPTSVTGNLDYECYTITGLTGNVSVFSTTELYLAAYGNNGAATFGGYYSGFTFKPEITYQPITASSSNCIPNVNLQVNSLSGFDTYQWFFNDLPIAGATTSSYNPTQPGYYYVSATISACVSTIPLISDKIPVSICPTNSDSDASNDNADLDNDNDGITNCNESYGNQPLDISNINSGSINVNSGAYTNTFTGVVTTSTTASPTPITGNSDGSFVSQIPAGKTNFAKYELTFTQPITIALDYVTTANAANLISSDSQFTVNSPTDKTVTVLNPDNQLLIDTNYDGIYESGVTQFSSFEIRFRLNSTTSLPAGTGTFRFISFLSTTLSFKHENLSDTNPSNATLKFYAVCVPKDSDNDGITDDLDHDSDNDGITDTIEVQGSPFTPISNNDVNNDGIDDAFANGINPTDTDNDGVFDYLDLDSDNDGIYDLSESGSNATDTNGNGVIDGTNFGTNGLNNALETAPDSGILNFIVSDTDADGINNYIELDSDNDLCTDVIEAGYTDANSDGLLGATTPPTVNQNGVVTSGTGYTNPNNNYIISAPIVITTQPSNTIVCELEDASFTIDAVGISTYQWEQSVDGTTWTTLTNNASYSGANTATLTVNNVANSMNNYKYRVFLNRNGNSCGLYSAAANLAINALPVIANSITLVQCDDDTDGSSTFNLTQKNNQISTNAVNEVFTYYTNATAAETENNSFLITNPIAYTTTNTTVYARVENANGCYRVCTMTLVVSVTQIPSSFQIDDFVQCDDFVDVANNDKDGIATFNFSSATAEIVNVLPTGGNYTIKYYKNEADFLAETDSTGNSLEIPIATISNYRNSGYPNIQTIWARVDSTVANDCYGFTTFNLVVEALPIINVVGTNNVIRACDDDQDGVLIFNTSNLESTLLGGQTNKTIVYTDQSGTVIPSPFPPTYQVTTSQIISVYIKNDETVANDAPCNETGTFQFIVDDLPQAFDLPLNTLTKCDDNETDPSLQDGKYPFNTTTIQSDILQGQTGMIVTYTFADGTTSNTLPNPFDTATQTVIARVTNSINTTCWDETELKFIVNPIPKINLNANGQDNELVCTNLPTFTATLDAGITDGTPQSAYTYQWFLNNTPLANQTNYTISVIAEGTYTVAVTNSSGCTSTRTIVVTASDIASIQNIEIVDLTDNNSVLINVTGSGDYVYSIQESYGPYQTSNLFENVPIGFHTVYIKDLNGCGIAEQLISVLGVPKYFTPNGDGFNDTWNIKGANANFYSGSLIYIFDRFGKLVKQISPIGSGWDGTVNGNLAPSDDYWYSIKFDDGRSAKGHFSLKR